MDLSPDDNTQPTRDGNFLCALNESNNCVVTVTYVIADLGCAALLMINPIEIKRITPIFITV